MISPFFLQARKKINIIFLKCIVSQINDCKNDLSNHMAHNKDDIQSKEHNKDCHFLISIFKA